MQIGGSSIPPFSTQDVTVPVQPLHVGQIVKVAPHAPLDPSWSGILWTAFVRDENQVTIRLANISAAAVTPAVQEFDFKA
jgi:hypothetical protein